MIAQVHRDPAHVDRTGWRFEHVTTPQPAWCDGGDGMKRRIRRIVERLLIGDEVELPDGRRVGRDAMYDYTIWRNAFMIETKIRGKKAVIHYLTGYCTPVVEPPAPAPRRTQYHHVFYMKRENAWRTEVTVNKVKYHIAYRKTDVEAARAYDAFVIAHGLNRPLNFPLELEKAS